MNKKISTLIKFKNELLVLFFVLFSLISNSQINYLIKAKSYYVLDSNIFYAEKYLQQCIEKPTDTKKITEAYEYLIANYLNIENADNAQKLALQIQKLALKLNNKEMEYVAINLFGDIEKFQKNYSKAVDFYLQSYDLLEKNNSWDYLCKCAIDLIELNRAIANYRDAEIYIKKSFNIYHTHKLKDLSILARLYNRTAAVKNETGTLELIDSSIVYSKRALEINQQLKNIHSEAVIWNELGYSYRHLNKIDTAELCFIKAEKIWLKIGAYNYAINAMNNRAGLYGRFNIKNKQRLDIYFEIIDIVKQKNLDYDIYTVYKGLSEEFFRQGSFENGQKYLNLYTEEYTKKLEKIYSAQIDDIKEKYESRKIKEEVKQMSGKLSESEKTLHQKNKENRLIYLVLSVFVVLIVVIIFLLYRVNKKNLLLKIKNEEKSALVQEIHHRVKNNLQFVNSIINMQLNSNQNQPELMGLKDTSRRILSMSLVHEMLFNKDNESNINMKQYLGELVKNIDDLSNTSNNKIEFVLDVEELFFDVSTATAMGMITSELLSNSLKYAFEKTESPIIKISLKEMAQNTFILFYSDNGVGLPDNINKTNKLGMRLIDIFSRQIKGNYTFENNNGLTFNLEFVIEN